MKRALVLIAALAACRSAAPREDARVVAWERDTVVLSVGAADGVKPGDAFDIRRGGKLVGRTYVTRVEERTASGTFEETWGGVGGPPKAGDTLEKVPRPPVQEWQVLAVDGRSITVSVGQNDGVKPGDAIHCARGDKHVGLAYVMVVRPWHAVAALNPYMADSSAPPRAGDRAYALERPLPETAPRGPGDVVYPGP